jgi:hypothetical protein
MFGGVIARLRAAGRRIVSENRPTTRESTTTLRDYVLAWLFAEA